VERSGGESYGKRPKHVAQEANCKKNVNVGANWSSEKALASGGVKASAEGR
jgi:hypothetical protein